MRYDFSEYIITPQDRIFEAIKLIDKNTKGFLIVIDGDKVAGVLTDGDIRRAFINGMNIDNLVSECFTRNIKYLTVHDSVGVAIDLFKNEAIKFLPVITDDGELDNIFTKNQMHALLLQDISADLTYDFMSLDENIVDYEIFQRPWGFYKTTGMNEYCQSKIICVYPKGQLSLQSHDHREEHWIIAHGNGLVQIGESVIEAKCGSLFFIPKGCKHRLTNTDENENLILNEVQIGDYFGEDDIHRYEDIYGRG